MQNPLILVTNDDGISSKGIRELIGIARSLGDVIVVAPDGPQSGKSHSITQEKVIQFRHIVSTQGYDEYACSGTPVDAVKIALHEICKTRKPDFVFSGINHGTNASVSVLYSGTMGAAIEGTINGMHSVGFSIDDYSDDAEFSHILPHIHDIAQEIVANGLPAGVSLNVNFPKACDKPLAGVKVVRGAKGNWIEQFYPANHPYGLKTFWLAGSFLNYEPDAEDTDLYVIKQNFGSIVPIHVDFNAYEHLAEIGKRF